MDAGAVAEQAELNSACHNLFTLSQRSANRPHPGFAP